MRRDDGEPLATPKDATMIKLTLAASGTDLVHGDRS